MSRISIIGTAGSAGTYVLRVHVARELQVRFGRFQGGVALPVAAGCYVYVGSALRGLGPRVLRHAARRQGAYHQIYEELYRACAGLGLIKEGFKPRAKRLYWHVDYLLEESAVALTHLLLIRSPERLENRIARGLGEEQSAAPLAQRLGATDDPGQTHIFWVPETIGWWTEFVRRQKNEMSRKRALTGASLGGEP